MTQLFPLARNMRDAIAAIDYRATSARIEQATVPPSRNDPELVALRRRVVTVQQLARTAWHGYDARFPD